MHMTKHILILAAALATLSLGACATDDTATADEAKIGGAKGLDIDQACGEMPWPDPGFALTKYPGTGGTVCMTDADYLKRDLYQQSVRDWAICAEIQTCRNRGECQ